MPNVALIIGVGGSGGAIAIATANRVLMLEHSFYSVISPEGAASILWRDTTKAQEAATSMKITAQDLARFGVIDRIVTEPVGGAHRDPAATIAAAGEAIADALDELKGLDRETVRRQRREKFLAIGRTIAGRERAWLAHSSASGHRLCDRPRVLDEELRDRAQRTVLQGDDRDGPAIGGQLDRQRLDRQVPGSRPATSRPGRS